ncbi:hypothetical protein HETIRDRAFT_103440 [Heterobasidion irregulare TC 32-1]|uniref:CMP/dCMP-type deaminase domain-containing protein n=1 Tax=Heterobasidion irregulare (strain TC 32-1) TaxID=747525 RepID=W4K2I8_HETIT|nr:uncharacterized protein HETIRDRAFT_103440 [Heterobasidion irregulare TC 32-1]ETW80027.1 hypothetical protein HETIRDRAFT_103440 [Heterobasidion irregulare TC 32-1]
MHSEVKPDQQALRFTVNKTQFYLSQYADAAAKSSMCYTLGAVLVKGGKVISSGVTGMSLSFRTQGARVVSDPQRETGDTLKGSFASALAGEGQRVLWSGFFGSEDTPDMEAKAATRGWGIEMIHVRLLAIKVLSEQERLTEAGTPVVVIHV